MREYFQKIFVGPTDKSSVNYKGTIKGNRWINGKVCSTSNEYQVQDGIIFLEKNHKEICLRTMTYQSG
ncbi:hypothetical protein PV797_10025 [Clostridiaceae bacterium M8S5]|nr:hypothetical protein PV797_10025 [Clostridiaceae bacterium M8S5]